MPSTVSAAAASVANGSSAAYHSSAVAATSTTTKFTKTKACAARLIGGSKRCTRLTSKCGLCHAGPPAVAGCQPGGMNQMASLSRQRAAAQDLRARSAYTSTLAQSGSQDSSGARVPYTHFSSSSTNVPNRRSHSMVMPP